MTNPYCAELVQRVRRDSRYIEIEYGRRVPDGGIVRILKNSAYR